MKLVFLGPPGAGKGTLAAKVVDMLGVPHISTGNIFREAMAAQSPLGIKVKAIIDGGSLVDDDTTVALVRSRLAADDAQSGYILDGFPRTCAQADALAEFSALDRVINFDISDAVVVERLSGRLVCRKCGFNWHKTHNPPAKAGICDRCGGEIHTRDDDQPAAIQKRLEVYRTQTAPLIGYYREKKLLLDIDARPDVSMILLEFKNILDC